MRTVVVLGLFLLWRYSSGRECLSNVCFNGGKCIVEEKGTEAVPVFECHCPKGFGGTLCEEEQNCPLECPNGTECQISPTGQTECKCPKGQDCIQTPKPKCPNECPKGKSCLWKEKGFECLENKCLPTNPCALNSTCRPMANDYICECPIGRKGKRCDQFECSEECLNGGKCGPKGECECSPGFGGKFCSQRIGFCIGNPCGHNGQCEELPNDFKCLCSEGFLGKRCEGEKCEKECKDCLNGGKCFLNSEGQNQCLCPNGFSGPKCEKEEECEKKCKENEKCEKGRCECFGEFCDFPMASSIVDLISLSDQSLPIVGHCDQCVHSTKCVGLKNGVVCVCGFEYGGSNCSRALSNICRETKCPNGRECRHYRFGDMETPFCDCPPETFGPNCSVGFPSLSFGPSSIAVLHNHRSDRFSLEFSFRTTLLDSHLVTGENIWGKTEFSFRLADGFLMFVGNDGKSLQLGGLVNDADWYSVALTATAAEIRHSESDTVLSRLTISELRVFALRFGRGRDDSSFSGCLRDIRLNGEAVEFGKDRSVDLSLGCSWEPQCSAGLCANGGKCKEKWTSYECECLRPFVGADCSHLLQEGTFGFENKTTKVHFLSDEIDGDLDFSFIVRTNSLNGEIALIGQNNTLGNTFIRLFIQNGLLAVETNFGDRTTDRFIGKRKIDDNELHIVEIRRSKAKTTAKIDGKLEFEYSNEHSFDLKTQNIVLGGDSFKGTLQDPRLNDQPLLFADSPIISSVSIRRLSAENLQMGTLSDDLCSQRSPCRNGGSNTFNDYKCECRKGFMGKHCELTDFCSKNLCPQLSQCSNTHGGYICRSPATFAPTSVAAFVPKFTGNLSATSNFSFAIRSRTAFGRIFQMKNGNESFWMELSESKVVFHSSNGEKNISDPFGISISDGQWHSIGISEIDGNLSVSFGNNFAPLLGNFSLRKFVSSNFSVLSFGRFGNSSGFRGCLHNLRFDSVPEISFLSKNSSGVSSLNGIGHFEMEKAENLRTDGCHSAEECGHADPCQNGALCRDLFDSVFCDCADGFRGKFCEVGFSVRFLDFQENIDECFGNESCGEFGECIDGANGFRCECRPGFSGPFCSVELDQCVGSPCENGAKCSTVNGRFHCLCAEAFVGRRCQIGRETLCSATPCRNSALSCLDTEMGPKCECSDGFSGDLCEESKAENECSKIPCRNGGKCLPEANGTFSCECSHRYGGEFCDQLLDVCETEKPCRNGRCLSANGGFRCECSDGWFGKFCQFDRNECILDFPCINGGQCSNRNGSYECECSEFYSGQNCEIVGICADSPCLNGGLCSQRSNTEYICNCPKGYSGQNCEVEIDFCTSAPCSNGASCIREVGGFRCNCAVGFTGENCETNIDDCLENICENGGKCRDRVNGFECDCGGTGYKGIQCGEDVDECVESGLNCVNGVCHNRPGSYECICSFGFVGNRCDKVDPCVPDIHNHSVHNCVHGRCVRSRVITQPSGREAVEHDCECDNGFEGPQCTHLAPKARTLAVGYLIGPLVALLVVCGLLAVMLFFFVARNRRANQGSYRPSSQEMNGVRTESRTAKPDRLI